MRGLPATVPTGRIIPTLNKCVKWSMMIWLMQESQKWVCTDKDGNDVREGEICGLKQDLKIVKPNVSGCRTFQQKDGNVGKTRLIAEKGTVPQVI